VVRCQQQHLSFKQRQQLRSKPAGSPQLEAAASVTPAAQD
jgi:hypothetical protein